MCSIIACYSPSPDSTTAEMLTAIFMESRIRGLHAAGFAFYDQGDTLHVARYASVDDAVSALASLRLPSPLRFIGHCRYSTSGDWNDMNNNQPLCIRDVALAFNGVLHMGMKQDMEGLLGSPMATDNDGELFIRTALTPSARTYGALPPFLCNGSFAGVWLQHGRLYVRRNTRRPAWYARSGNDTYVVSTRDIARRAALPHDAEPVTADETMEVAHL